MALDFPANPTNGQAYGSYIYNGTIGAWQGREDSRTVAVLSPTVPATANPGDIWINTNDATTFVYYNDGTSSQWIEIFSSGTPFTTSKANLTGGNAFTGAQSITSTATTQVPLTINGIAAQTANLQEWKDSVGTLVAYADPSGNINAAGNISAASFSSNNGSISISGTATGSQLGVNYLKFSRASASYLDNTVAGGYLVHRGTTTTAADTIVWFSSPSAGLILNPSGNLPIATIPLTVKGSTSQSGDLQQWQGPTATVLGGIKYDGTFYNKIGFQVGSESFSGITYNGFSNPTSVTSLPTLMIKGIASQTADLQQWTDSSNNVVSRVSVDGILQFTDLSEYVTVSATAATGTINYDVITNKAVMYYTAAATGNWTLNIRGSGTKTFNNTVNVGQSLTVVFMVTNGATAYRQTGLTIDGVAVTPKWQNGYVPLAGDINSINTYTVTIIKTAASTYTVLESLAKFA